MKTIRNLSVLASLAAAFIAGTAAADTVSGGGGPIPASGSGGGGSWLAGGSATVMPTFPANFSVIVPNAVASVNSITLTGMTHSWIGDLQVVLVDPNGVGHNIMVRPGLFDAGSTVGHSSNFSGNYTFVESGGTFNLPTTVAGANSAFNHPSGTYNQTFGGSAAAGATWANGNFNIFNTPMSGISGSAGTWTLRIFDWAALDPGSLQGWTLDYNPVPAPGALALLGLAGLAARTRRRS